jgi:transposase-like protein
VRILEPQFPKAAAILDAAEIDVLAHTTFPRGHWRKIASANPLERINKEIPVFYLSMPQGPRRWPLRSVIVPRSDSKEISTPHLRRLSSV